MVMAALSRQSVRVAITAEGHAHGASHSAGHVHAAHESTLQQHQRQPKVEAAVKLSLLSAMDPHRQSIEQFIANGFAEAYGANVSHFMPDLLAVSARGEWQAVLGIRGGQNSQLFVEQYLDADICTVLSEVGVACQRSDVVEIGNLYAANRQFTLLLFVVLAYALHQLGYRQLVCCATTQVQNLLSRHGLALTQLAAGDPARLGDAAASWGTYYQTHPQVCRLDLAQAMQLITGDAKLAALPHQYWPALHATVTALSLETDHV
jgi:hypothetical protein